MITAEQIKTANYDHSLTIMGIDCKGATITVNDKSVLIAVDKETNALIHHEVANPVEIQSDWSLFTI